MPALREVEARARGAAEEGTTCETATWPGAEAGRSDSSGGAATGAATGGGGATGGTEGGATGGAEGVRGVAMLSKRATLAPAGNDVRDVRSPEGASRGTPASVATGPVGRASDDEAIDMGAAELTAAG